MSSEMSDAIRATPAEKRSRSVEVVPACRDPDAKTVMR
jgi:hypothetical protein